LTELTGKKVWKWQEEGKSAFNKLKNKMMNPPTLAIPHPKRKMRLETNASGYAERGKRDVYCDKQVGKAVTVLNCMLKGLWGEYHKRSLTCFVMN